MKKLLILGLVVLGVLLGGRAWGQATVPAAFNLSTSFSLATYSTTTSFPSNMAIGSRNNSTDGNFTDDITTDASGGSGAGLWNAEGANGISYQGGSSSGNGSFLLRLNSTGRNTIVVGWIVKDISIQLNTNYIELQWRVGGSGAWNNVTGDLYQQGSTASGTSFSVTLPSGADNQSDLRVRWIYYEIGSNTRDRLAIDDLSVTSSAPTSCSTPTTQASVFTTSNIQETSMTVGFTRGNGNSVLVVAKQGSAVDQDPVNDVLYTSNSTFGSGDQIGTGNYVVYSGASNTFNLTGLVPSTTYHFAVYELNVAGAFLCYNTTELAGSQTTAAALVCPNTQSTFTSAANPTQSTLDVSWTRGDGDYVLVVARSSSAVTSGPVNGNLYNDNAAFGSGDQIGTGNYVVYDGTGTGVTVTGLSASTTYHFAVYEYKIDGSNVCYKTPAAIGNGTTSAPPSTVVIYEVYGGGGNTGAAYCNDYVILKNCSASDINIGGYSIQYTSAAGTFSTGAASFYQIPSNTTITAGGLLGIRFAAGTGTTCSSSYPSYFTLTPDNIAIGASNAKVALVNNGTVVSGPTDANVVDFVGCGTANQYETAAAPAMSNTLSIYRSTNDGCNDSGNNSADFATKTPALPIELLSFKAVKKEIHSLLTFATASERNNARFEIERSADGRVFQVIGVVKGAGDAQTQNNYTFTDEHPMRGINYYRLRQVDVDGASTLSQVVSVTFGKTGNVVLYPTPASETMNVRFDEAFTTDANWQIVDLTGRILNEGIFAAEQTEFRIPVASLTQGAYILRVTANNEVVTQQFRKQ